MALFKIKPDKLQDFYEFWRRTIIIEDRTAMVSEFLCEAKSKEDLQYITRATLSSTASGIAPSGKGYKSFVHVSIWRSVEAFESQVAHHFNDTAPLRPFESRIRTVMRSLSGVWEIELPKYDSGGVL